MEFWGIAWGALQFGLVLVIGLLTIGVVILAYLGINRWRIYNEFLCIVLGRDGLGNHIIKYDKAGIFVDKKTNNKRFFMKRNNVGLSPDNVPAINDGKKKIVFLLQHGLKNFSFVKVNLEHSINFEVTEEDVNWAINAYERQKKLFSTSTLMQMLPFIALAFTSIIILIIFIYFFREFGVLKEVAVALQESARIIATASGGTTVIN